MTLKHQANTIVDVSIIVGYSTFAFAVMPLFVLSAWVLEHTFSSAHVSEAEAWVQ